MAFLESLRDGFCLGNAVPGVLVSSLISLNWPLKHVNKTVTYLSKLRVGGGIEPFLDMAIPLYENLLSLPSLDLNSSDNESLSSI